MLTKSGTPVLFEMNSVPGLGPNSIIPKSVCAMGWTMEYFFRQLISNAL